MLRDGAHRRAPGQAHRHAVVDEFLEERGAGAAQVREEGAAGWGGDHAGIGKLKARGELGDEFVRTLAGIVDGDGDKAALERVAQQFGDGGAGQAQACGNLGLGEAGTVIELRRVD